MKKWIFTLFTSAALFAAELKPGLQRLLERFNIEATQSREEILSEVQQLWLRKFGQERWELPAYSPDDHADIVDDLFAMGYIGEIGPQKKYYDYCLVLGATIPSMKKRLEYLGDLWWRGVRFTHLVFLASNRPISQKGDRMAANESFRDEMEALIFLYENSALPRELKEVPVKIALAKRNMGRANTTDTLAAWLAENPSPGSALAISTQPHVKYQEAVLCGLLPEEFSVEVVGSRASEEMNLASALDAYARTLYTKLEIEKKNRYPQPYEKPWNRPSSPQEHSTRKQAPADH